MIITNNKFIFLRILIVVVSLALIIISSFYPDSYTYVICERNTNSNVICIREKKEGYGLLNNSILKFPLTAFEIKKETKIIHIGKGGIKIKYSQGIQTSLSIDIYIFFLKSYLQEKDISILLYKKSTNGYLTSIRETEQFVKETKQKIENLLKGVGKSSYEYEETTHSYLISIMTFFLAWIALRYVKQAENRTN